MSAPPSTQGRSRRSPEVRLLMMLFRRPPAGSKTEAWSGAGLALVLAFYPKWDVAGKARGTRHLLALAREAGAEVRAFGH